MRLSGGERLRIDGKRLRIDGDRLSVCNVAGLSVLRLSVVGVVRATGKEGVGHITSICYNSMLIIPAINLTLLP